jgi:hypothetical protein
MPLPQPSALLGPDRTQSDVPVPSAAVPAVEFLALNRMGYGPRPEDPARVRAMGLEAYIDEQLNPGTISDTLCDQKLAAARLRISYPVGVSYPARDEAVGLNFLNSSVAELWARANFGMEQAWQERMRPWDEVRVAAYLRAIYSKRQLQELLVEFWHNHFSVNPGADAAISAGFPAYDRLMRQHCLGNFRTFLEEVAKSTAMLYSLDNVSNRVSGGEGGNENYARELFELHTLGSDNYLKVL